MRYALMLFAVLPGFLHAAGLTFENLEQEVTAPADAPTVTIDFPFKNETDKPVSIQKYDAGCTCIAVQISDGKLRYEPGESGVIRAVFSTGNYMGTIDRSVAVWFEGDATAPPSRHLKVRVHIPLLVEMEPRTLKWDIGAAPEPQTITILMRDKDPIRVLSVSSTLDDMKHELKTVEEGRHYEIVVTPGSTATAGLGIIRIETDCKVQRFRVSQAFAVVRNAVPGEVQP